MNIIQIIAAQPGWVAKIKEGKKTLPVVCWALVERDPEQQKKPGNIQGSKQAVIGLVLDSTGQWIQTAEAFTGFKGYGPAKGDPNVELYASWDDSQ